MKENSKNMQTKKPVLQKLLNFLIIKRITIICTVC
jgi:hypothetical protein